MLKVSSIQASNTGFWTIDWNMRVAAKLWKESTDARDDDRVVLQMHGANCGIRTARAKGWH